VPVLAANGGAEAQRPFVGRADEQERFLRLASSVATSSQIDRNSSWVSLVYGLGGIGKSRLLGSFQGLLAREQPGKKPPAGSFHVVEVDWEEERREAPAAYPGDTPPTLTTVLLRLQRAALDGLEPKRRLRADRSFDRFRLGVTVLSRWAERLNRLQAEAQAGGVGLSSEEVGALSGVAASLVGLGLGLPPAIAALPLTNIGEAFVGAGKTLGGLQQIIRRTRHGKIDAEEFNLLFDPPRDLCLRLAQGLRELSSEQPLAIFLDTYEIVQGLGMWFRELMLNSGEHVLWVIGARLEPESQAGASAEVAEFYRRLPGDQFVAMPLHRLDDAAVRQYLAEAAPDRHLTDSDVDAIAAHTRGIPLALSIAAKLLENGLPVEMVCKPYTEEGPGGVVKVMAERYLIHARKASGLREDLSRIYGLALIYGERVRDPDVLWALWGDEQHAGERLDELIAQYDFVLTESRLLHPDVRDAVLAYLMDPERRADVRAANERAATVLEDRLEHRRQLRPALDERLEDETYQRDVLALIWHRFWSDRDFGQNTLLGVLPILAVYDRQESALQIAAWFAAAGSRTDRERLDALRAVSSSSPSPFSPSDLARLRRSGLAMLRGSGQPATPVLTTPEESRAALALLASRLQDGPAEMMTALSEADKGVVPGTKLAAAIADGLLQALQAVLWPGGTRFPVAAPGAPRSARLVTRLMPEIAEGWHFLSVAESLDRNSRMAAVDAGRKANELDPNDPSYIMDQAVPLTYEGRVDAATDLIQKVIELDVSYASAWSSLGYLYLRRGLYQLALECQDAAIELDSKNATAIGNRAAALQAGRDADSAQIEASIREAISLDPSSPMNWFRLAMLFASREDYGAAVEAAGNAAETAGTRWRRPLVLVCRGACLHAAGDAIQARAQFADGVAAWPDAWRSGEGFDADKLWWRAVCELGDNRPREALETLIMARLAFPHGMFIEPFEADVLQLLSTGPEFDGLDEFTRVAQAMLAPEPPPLLSSSEELAHARRLNALADLLSARGNAAVARKWYEIALRRREPLLPEDDPELMDSLSGLGVALVQEGETETGRPYLERVFATRERSLPTGDPGIAAAGRDLGVLLWSAGDMDGAANYISRAAQPAGDKVDLDNLRVFGQIQWARGKFPEARELFETALLVCESTRGPYSPETASMLRQLGSLLWAQGDTSEAAPYLERANAIDPVGLMLPALGHAGSADLPLAPRLTPAVEHSWARAGLAPGLDAAISSGADVQSEFRRSAVLALGTPAGEITEYGGSESDLLHFTIGTEHGNQVLLPVFTQMPAVLTGLVRGGPDWWQLLILEIQGGALLSNTDPDVTIVINPWTHLEYRLEPIEFVLRQAQAGQENRVREAVRSADIYALGQPAGDTSVPDQGTESNLLFYTIDDDTGAEVVMLPIFTNPAAMREALIRNSEWQTQSILQINGGALLDNAADDVTIVINPWTDLEYQLPPQEHS